MNPIVKKEVSQCSLRKAVNWDKGSDLGKKYLPQHRLRCFTKCEP